MKRSIKLILVIVLGLLLITGCTITTKQGTVSTSTSVKEDVSNPLVGSWEYEGGGYVYTFEDNMTGVYDLGSSKMKFSYEVNDDKLSILYEGNTASFDTTFRIEGNTLIIKDSLDNDVKYVKK